MKEHPFDVTLSTSGVEHAELYIEMMDKFGQAKPDYCPIRVVYALNPENFDGSIGTSNPYWTADPLAQRWTIPPGNPNPIISVQVMNQILKLTEYLNHGEGDKFVEDIKGTLNNQQSVAIFWTSQGMCEVAKRLGQPDIGYDCVASKPPRNSVFRFNYDVLLKTFTSVTTKYAQCFNYNASTDSFTTNIYYCQFSANLADWEGKPGFSTNLEEISGQICDTHNPDSTCKLQ